MRLSGRRVPPVPPAGFRCFVNGPQQAYADAHASRESALWVCCGYAADNERAGSGPRLFNELLIDMNLRFNFVPPCSS